MIGEGSFDKMAESVNSLLLSLWSEQRIVAHWEDEGGGSSSRMGRGGSSLKRSRTATSESRRSPV